MGSFYSSCSVSHMRLTNQKTSVQLLVPGYGTDLQSHKGMIVSNEGAQAFYSPFGFPIHGRYYDYGYLEDIVEDNNTKMLEEYFNMSIDDIIRYIGRERDVPKDAKNVDFYNQLSMTYIRTEVLEHLQDGWQDIDLVNPKQYTGSEMLSKFFNFYFRDKSNEQKRLEYLESLENFTDEEKLEYTNLIRYGYDQPRNYITISKNKNMFNLLPIDISFKDDILKQYQFLINFGWGLGRTLMPSDYGTQEDNFLQLYKLNDLVNDLLIEDMKYSYYEDEESEEIDSVIRSHQRNKNLKELDPIISNIKIGGINKSKATIDLPIKKQEMLVYTIQRSDGYRYQTRSLKYKDKMVGYVDKYGDKIISCHLEEVEYTHIDQLKDTSTLLDYDVIKNLGRY